MSLTRLFFCCIGLLLCTASRAQQFATKHYSTREGLVGNNVYHCAVDQQGFLWFGTETGASRFDGSHFTNYTTAEGLPDNEIIRIFVDKKGRVWLLPFKNKLCYYYRGKIYNEYNDPMLAKINLTNTIVNFVENSTGDLMIQEHAKIIIVRHDNKVLVLNTLQMYTQGEMYLGAGIVAGGKFSIITTQSPVLQAPQLTVAYITVDVPADKDTLLITRQQPISKKGDANFFPYINGRSFIYPRNCFVFHKGIFYCHDAAFKPLYNFKLPDKFNIPSPVNDSVFFINTVSGAIMLKGNAPPAGPVYLAGQNVSNTTIDPEGNLWFTTLGNGVWCIPSKATNSYHFGASNSEEQVTALFSTPGGLLIGTNERNLYQSTASGIKAVNNKYRDDVEYNQYLKILPMKDRLLLVTSKDLLTADLYGNGLSSSILSVILNQSPSYKDAAFNGDDEIALASSGNTYLFNLQVIPFTKKNLIPGRSTSVAYFKKQLYIGALTGLYRQVTNDTNKVSLAGTHPLLANRITKLLTVRNILWIGTNDNGVVGYDGQRVIANISTRQGLTGNIVRSLYSDNNYLWVGTDRGLNKIDITDTNYRVMVRYTMADGLNSDMINAVYTNGRKVYVGTPEGLNSFDEDSIQQNSRCDLVLLNITVSGKELPYTGQTFELAHKDNNIRFDFTAISFKSNGDITYRYRLTDIDNDWKTTKDNFLQYPTLPSGKYILELQAINKFGVQSKPIQINFSIKKTLVEETWFRLSVLLAVLGLTWWLATLRAKVVRRRYKEKVDTSNKIAALEQQALRAQMNPHFIFNCLNSIQQFVIDKDVAGANRFITGFSRLIRQTLDNSGRQTVSLAEEELFLNAYLSLEKIRFEEKFNYNIIISSHLPKEEVYIPTMLLQPYIENSIRHGIRHRKGDSGLIEVSIVLQNDELLCSITDNGVGRQAAAAYKSGQHIEYQSQGMRLTGQRIALMNEQAGRDIKVAIQDLTDEAGNATGTTVTINIPIQHNNKLSK